MKPPAKSEVLEPPDALMGLIREEVNSPPPASVSAIAEAARQRHGDSIEVILFYGSVLRDRDDAGRIIDLYLLGDSYERLHGGRVMRKLNALLPPNVYYVETAFEGRTLRAKYALMTLDDFERLTSPRAFHPYFWARFAQPSAIAWAKDDRARERVERALAGSVTTLLTVSRPLMPGQVDARTLWTGAFRATYATELRAEPPERATQIYDAGKQRFDRIAEILLPALPVPDETAQRDARRQWAGRRRLGKLLSVLRLVKAAFTFQDGPDYLAWKISRHSGVKVELTDWQRRHPLLATPSLFWRLYRKGAFR